MSERVELPRAERCETCKFWVFQSDGKGGGPLDPLEDADLPWGFCRRYPPRADENNHEERDDYNCPRTSDTFWCGEWKPIPEPIPTVAANRVPESAPLVNQVYIDALRHMAWLLHTKAPDEIVAHFRRKLETIPLFDGHTPTVAPPAPAGG